MLDDLVEHKDRILAKRSAIVQRVKWKAVPAKPSVEKPLFSQFSVIRES